MAGFHVLLLIVSVVTGQPVAIVTSPSKIQYETMDACVQGAPSEIAEAAKAFSENGLADKVAVGVGMCWNADNTEHSDAIKPEKTNTKPQVKRGQYDI